MDAIQINKGGCLRFSGTWPSDGGLHGKSISVVEAHPAALKQTVVTIVDAAAGNFRGFAGPTVSATMGSGRVNWIRLGLSEGGACMDTTPRIWIEVT